MKTLRLIQLAMLGSVIVFVVVGETAGRARMNANPVLNYVLSTFAVAIVGMIFVVRRTQVLRAAESLAAHPDDGLSLRHWRTGYIFTYALCETLAMFGLVQRFAGFTFAQCIPFYLGGFVLLFFFAPRQPVTT